MSTPDPVQSDVQGAVRSSETLRLPRNSTDKYLVRWPTFIDQYLWSASRRAANSNCSS